jgi:hypothetical protein
VFNEEDVIYRYKYLPFSDGSLKTLTESTIKFTCPPDFNDPFDCKPFYDTTNIENVPHLRPDFFKEAGNRMGLSPAKRIMGKGQFVARLKNRFDEGNFAEEIVSKIGVVSLSKNALNILMWSHYADFHRGFVLEFRIPIIGTRQDVTLTNERLLPFEIEYDAKRPHIEIGTELPDSLINKLVLTKSLDWAYEEEDRVVDHERGPGIHSYRRNEILSSVIAGMNIESNSFEILNSTISDLAVISELDVTLYKAEEKKDEYKLVVPNHPRLS